MRARRREREGLWHGKVMPREAAPQGQPRRKSFLWKRRPALRPHGRCRCRGGVSAIRLAPGAGLEALLVHMRTVVWKVYQRVFVVQKSPMPLHGRWPLCGGNPAVHKGPRKQIRNLARQSGQRRNGHRLGLVAGLETVAVPFYGLITRPGEAVDAFSLSRIPLKGV